MKKKVFWIGAIVLVVGVTLFGYGYTTIQNISATYGIFLSTTFITNPEVKQQWDLAQMLQPIGLGLLALGAIMLAYGLFVKT